MKMLIGGVLTDSRDKKTTDVINPATGELIDTIPAATEEDLERCVAIAMEGKKIWRWTPLHERAKLLYKYADALNDRRKELSELLCKELGRPIAESEGAIDYTVSLIKSFVERARHLYGNVLPYNEPGQDRNLIFTKKEPLGIIATIIPFNYPVALLAFKMAPALVMGNAVIVKPASSTPLSCLRTVEIALEAGMPPEVMQSVTGGGSTVGRWISQNPNINAVSCTGGTEVGIDILKNAAATMKRVFVELGGNDALIICKDADLDLAVEESIIGRLTNNGQICSGSKRYIVHHTVKDEFARKLIDRLRKVKIGDPMSRDTEVGCLATARHAAEVIRQVELTVSQGAKLLYGGKLIKTAFVEPAVLMDVTEKMDVGLNMEIFGPVFSIMGFDDINDAIRIANSSKYGLQGGVITENQSLGLYVAERLECGTTVVNGTGHWRHMDHAFGGYKMSGMGREGVSETLEEMAQTKTYVMKNILKSY
jgi:succinate-semialdehyde dehydrogenase/glutarate-semialdehyde dehydrogenase